MGAANYLRASGAPARLPAARSSTTTPRRSTWTRCCATRARSAAAPTPTTPSTRGRSSSRRPSGPAPHHRPRSVTRTSSISRPSAHRMVAISRMAQFTTHTTANATPEQVLQVLTDPDEIRGWSPVPFEVEDLDGRRLAAGSQARVSGNLAGVPRRLRRRGARRRRRRPRADRRGPDRVRRPLRPRAARRGSEVTASVALHRRRRPHRPAARQGDRGAAERRRARHAASRVARAAESATALAA